MDIRLDVKHIMMTFAYKEPLELIQCTIDNIVAMERSKSVIMLVGLEEKTPDVTSNV